MLLPNPVFARHETFHPRFGWLKKGFDAAARDSEIFSREDAPVVLGVGKNMVRSIRYWCSAFKVIAEDKPTDFGEKLLGDEGWDPFLEAPASLWWLHWKLLEVPCNATAWYFAFYLFRQVEFSSAELLDTLAKYLETQEIRIAESSLKKDVYCILRMYADADTNKRSLIEDSINCPFAELGLIESGGKNKHYNFRVGSKNNLPAEIVAAACLEFAGGVGEQKTIAISKLCYETGSPGLAFKLPESAICESIEAVASSLDGVRLSESGGLVQLSFTKNPRQLAESILNRYYS